MDSRDGAGGEVAAGAVRGPRGLPDPGGVFDRSCGEGAVELVSPENDGERGSGRDDDGAAGRANIAETAVAEMLTGKVRQCKLAAPGADRGGERAFKAGPADAVAVRLDQDHVGDAGITGD